MSIEPSFGSHFFQNLTSLRIGYFSIKSINHGGEIDISWLKNQPVKQATKYIRWISLKYPLMININGRSGEGCVIKPQNIPIDVMNEDESSGI